MHSIFLRRKSIIWSRSSVARSNSIASTNLSFSVSMAIILLFRNLDFYDPSVNFLLVHPLPPSLLGSMGKNAQFRDE